MWYSFVKILKFIICEHCLMETLYSDEGGEN